MLSKTRFDIFTGNIGFFHEKRNISQQMYGAFVKPRVDGFCIGYSHSFKFNVIRLKSHRKLLQVEGTLMQLKIPSLKQTIGGKRRLNTISTH